MTRYAKTPEVSTFQGGTSGRDGANAPSACNPTRSPGPRARSFRQLAEREASPLMQTLRARRSPETTEVREGKYPLMRTLRGESPEAAS